MSKGRRLFVGGLVSAGLSLILAPRVAGSRRAALSRLRARGAASGAFSGTPCAAREAGRAVTPSAATAAARSPSDPQAGSPLDERGRTSTVAPHPKEDA